MSNKVDKLFKDKLESHALQPSAQAWEKVEARLGKKNKMVVWLRVAAALLLFGVLTFAGLNWKGERKQEIVKKEIEKPKEIVQPEIKNEAPKQIIKKNKVVKPVTPVAPIVIEEQEAQEVQQVAIVEEPVFEVPKPEIKKEKGITLTYSLPSIKKEEPVIAFAKEEPKKTGVQRVLEIAREVKNGDSPLAELREAKDDIFALDFRKDKNKKH